MADYLRCKCLYLSLTFVFCLTLFFSFFFFFLFIFMMCLSFFFFFFSSRRRHTRYIGDWSSDVCSSDLDLLEDLLADYEGTLILVSHDRDFIDRLATSTIGLDGTGRAVETPGGWQDFLSQNPGFFGRAAAPATEKPAAAAIAPRPAQAPP